jgi:dolichol-phosphate mannosyltransferase
MLVNVMIPAYDELSNLEILLPKIKEVAALNTVDTFQICIILRNQESPELIKQLRSYGVEVLQRSPTDSFGDAIRSAILHLKAESEITIFMDADGSHDPKTIPKLVEEMRSGKIDVAIASRYIGGGSSDNGIILKLMSRTLNIIFSVVLGIKARDISTNFKAYKSSALRQVNLTCNDFDVLEELLLKLQLLKSDEFQVMEIPDHFHNRMTGESKRRLGPFIIGYITTLFRLKYKKL